MHTDWLGKPYYSLNAYLKNTYHEKCYKIALDAGLSCPNRDGKVGLNGCIFCSKGGSGEFASKLTVCEGSDVIATSISKQLLEGKKRFRAKQTGNLFIAYFQAYTNTYGPLDYLRQIYSAALKEPDVIGISIATRPDCLSREILDLLSDMKKQYPDKFIWIELGLQTIHKKTADLINRGYPLSTFEKAVMDLREMSLPVIVHVILGLPGETKNDMYETVSYLNRQPIFGIKLQLLHILRDTKLAEMYQSNALPFFHVLSLDEYMEILIHCIELLSKDIVIHRVTGDGPKDLLIAPAWSLDKRNVLNTLHRKMRQLNTYQGRCFDDAGSIDPL